MSLHNFIQLSHRIEASRLKEINIQNMPEQLRSIAEPIVKPKRCFDNSFKLATSLNATYVLGIYCKTIPIEHAWLKIGDNYYDPTLEIVVNDTAGKYLSLVELSEAELISTIVEIDEVADTGVYPPMFETIKHHSNFSDLFISDVGRLRELYQAGMTININ